MSNYPTTSPTTWKRPPQVFTHRGWRIGLQIGFAAWFVLALATLDPNWARIVEGWSRGVRFLVGFLHPDFTSRWSDISKGLIESLTMTLTSTVAGVIISVPVGIGAAADEMVVDRKARRADRAQHRIAAWIGHRTGGAAAAALTTGDAELEWRAGRRPTLRDVTYAWLDH